MDGRNNQKDAIEKDGIVKALHKGGPLPSLRTYQGDVAEFIKEKDQSVASIVIKEREKKREKQIEESIQKKGGDGFKISFVAVVLSLLLIFTGVITIYFVMEFLKTEEIPVIIKQEIIPYNNEFSIANITKERLKSELDAISVAKGITVVRLSDINGSLINSAPSFFSFIGASLPSSLSRSLKPELFLGILDNGESSSKFLIISVTDFGVAFSGMLDWENTILKDLNFLIPEKEDILTDLDAFPILNANNGEWRDIIIKNKDIRGYFLGSRSLILYTFLDKNTILITNSEAAISDISSSFASRSVVR